MGFRRLRPSRMQEGSLPPIQPRILEDPPSLPIDSATEPNYVAAASYAGLFVYSRALGQAEVGLMYTTLKAKMAARGVTLQ